MGRERDTVSRLPYQILERHCKYNALRWRPALVKSTSSGRWAVIPSAELRGYGISQIPSVAGLLERFI